MRGPIKSTQDFWTGVLFAAFGAWTAIAALQHPLGTTARMGPGYFPLLLGMLLAGIGVFLVVRSLGSAAGGHVLRIDLWLLLRLLAAIGAFGLLLNPLGLILAAFIAVLIAAWAGPEFALGEAIVLAAVLSMSSWLIFVWGLKQTMPVWPAPFANYLGL